MKKILVLAPHTDDGELACGATISRFIRRGDDVYYVAFSSCADSLPDGYSEDYMIGELKRATSRLGIPDPNVSCLDFAVRRFEERRQEVLDSMLRIKSEINPDIVLSPSVHDIHQDHVTVAKECLRAFKKNTILQYEVPWNNFTFNNQLFICVDEIDVNNKVEAVKCYETQKERDYVREDFIRGLLRTHGVQIGHQYAEVFEIPRMIIDE